MRPEIDGHPRFTEIAITYYDPEGYESEQAEDYTEDFYPWEWWQETEWELACAREAGMTTDHISMVEVEDSRLYLTISRDDGRGGVVVAVVALTDLTEEEK